MLFRSNIPREQRFSLRGEVVNVYADDGAVSLYHDDVPGLMPASTAPFAMEFVVQNRAQLRLLQRGQTVRAYVRRSGSDYVLEDLRTVAGGDASNRSAAKPKTTSGKGTKK